MVRQAHIVLQIRDEGPGFDPRDVARRAGRESWGLTSMRERAELIGSMRPEDAERVPELHEVDVTAELQRTIEDAMGRYPQLRSASIPALWAVQRVL